MARGRAFNLTAEINLRGPANIRTVVADIRRQLGTVTANVNLNINPTSVRTLNNLSRSLQNLNRILPTTTTNLTAASAAMRDFASAVGGFNPGTMVRDLTAINTGMQNFGRNSTGVSANIAAARTEMEEFGRQSALAIRRFAAFSAPTAVIFGLTNAVRNGITAFIDFDTQLVKLQQVTGETRAGLSDLSAMITMLAKNYGVASSELTNVSLTLAQAGLTARDTEKALKALALSSLAPSFDSMNDTVEGSIALMKQFGISADELEQALGSINAVAAGFAVEASDIISAIQRTGGVFATASKGVSEGTDALNEFIAVFTSVRATTRESAETIATGLRTIFTRIQRSSTIEALKEYGVTLTDAQGKFVGAYKAIQLLSEGLNRIDPRDIKFSEIVEELGGFRQIGKVIPLIQQFATAQEALKVAQRGQASLSEDAAIAQLALANKVSKVREEFLALFREIGDSDSFQVIARGALDLASALIKVADSVKGILPLLTVMLAVRTARAVPEFISGFAGGISRQRQQGGRGFAKGGMVPVALTPGEAVFYPDAVNRVGVGNLRRMNHADRKAYAKGGGVGIVPGSGNSDSFYTSLPAGSFVVRKSATNAIGHSNIADIANGRKKYAGGGPIKNYAGDSRLLNRVQLDRSQLDKPAGQIFIPEGNQANRLNPGDKFRFNIVEKKIDVNKDLNQSLSSVKYYNKVKGNDSARGKAFEKVLEQAYGAELSKNPTARLDGITKAGTPFEAKSYKEAITEQEIGRKIIGSAIAGAANSKAGAKLGAKLQAVELNSKINTVDLGAVRLYTDLVTSASGLKQEKKKKKQQRAAFGGLIQKLAGGSDEPLAFPGRKQYLSAFSSIDDVAKKMGMNRTAVYEALGKRGVPANDPTRQKLMEIYNERVGNVARAQKAQQTKQARGLASGRIPRVAMLAFEGKGSGKKRMLTTPEGKQFQLVKGVMDPKLAESFSATIIAALTPVMQKEVMRFAGMQGVDLSGMKPDRMAKILGMMKPQLMGALGEALVHGVGGTEPALTKKGRAGGLDLPTGISPAVAGMFNLAGQAETITAAEIKKAQSISKKRFTAQVGRGLERRAFGGLIQKLSRGDRVGVFDFDMTTGITEQKETPSLSGFKNPKLAVPDILEAKPTGLLRLMREYGASSVLTARSGGPQGEMRSALQTFFNKNGILVPSSRLITLGDQIGDMSTPEKKARSLFEMVKKYGRGKVDFFDDDPRNIEAARDVKGVNARRVKVRRASGGEIPIMAQKGEYVINKHSAKNIGYGNLETLNKYHSGGAVGNVQKLAGGGFVQRFLFGGSPRPPARPDLGGAVPGTEAANKLLGVSNSVTASLNKLAESLNQLGVSSSSSAAIIRKGNQVSYDAAIKAYESDIKRAQVAGASAADIIAMETQLSNIRKQAERSGLAAQKFKGRKGDVLQDIEDLAAEKRQELTDKERDKIKKEKIKGKRRTTQQVEEELARRSERINSKAYRQAATQVTGIDLKGLKGSDVQNYIRNSMRDRATLDQMDKQYVINRKASLAALGKSDDEAEAIAKQEVKTRRKIVDDLAKQSGAVGPNTANKDRNRQLMTASFILPMITGQLASAFDKTANAFSAQMSSAIESFGNTFATGTFLTSSAAELLPEGPMQTMVGAIGLAASALIGLGSAAIAARNAYIEFERDFAKRRISDAIESLGTSFQDLEKDIKNAAIQKTITEKLTQATTSAQKAISVERNIPKAFWINMIDAFAPSSRAGEQLTAGESAAQRSKILETKGTGAYLQSFFNADAQQAYFSQIIPDIARNNAKIYTEIADNTFRLVEAQLKGGTNIQDILGGVDFTTFADAIAGANTAIQQQILLIESSTNLNEADKQAKISSIKAVYAEQEIRKRAAVIAREKEIQAAEQATNVLSRSLERMFQNMDQAIGATTSKLEQMGTQLDATVAALSGQAKISKTQVQALDVLRNPRGFSEAEQRMARTQGASLFGNSSKIVEGLLSIGDDLDAQILRTINDTINANRGANNEQVAAAIQKAVNQQLSDLELPADVSKKLSNEVKVALADMAKSGEEKLDFTQIVEKIPQLGKVVDSARAAQERAIKVLEFWQTSLNNYAERINQAADLQIEANNRYRRANQIVINSQIELDKVLGKEITMRRMVTVRRDEIRAQTGGPTDPRGIYDNIMRLERERANQEGAVRMAVAAGPGANTNKNFIELNDKLKNTNIALRENYDALKNLAENTDLASFALNKIQEIQQKQQGRGAFLEKLVTSTPEELGKLNGAFVRLQNNINGQQNTFERSQGAAKAFFEALSSGSSYFDAMKAAQEAFVNERRETLGALNDLLPFLGAGQEANKIRANVLETMLQESGIGMNPMLENVLKEMRNPEADPQMKEAIDQYRKVVDLQSEANKLLGNLNQYTATKLAKDSADALKFALQNVTLTFTNQELKDIKDRVQSIDNKVLPGAVGGLNVNPQAKARGGLIYAAQGQMIDFQPKGTDTVPAMLTRGEFVVNKKATQENLPLLNSINNGYSSGGKVKYYADGGYVGSNFMLVNKLVKGDLDTIELLDLNLLTDDKVKNIYGGWNNVGYLAKPNMNLYGYDNIDLIPQTLDDIPVPGNIYGLGYRNNLEYVLPAISSTELGIGELALQYLSEVGKTEIPKFEIKDYFDKFAKWDEQHPQMFDVAFPDYDIPNKKNITKLFNGFYPAQDSNEGFGIITSNTINKPIPSPQEFAANSDLVYKVFDVRDRGWFQALRTDPLRWFSNQPVPDWLMDAIDYNGLYAALKVEPVNDTLRTYWNSIGRILGTWQDAALIPPPQNSYSRFALNGGEWIYDQAQIGEIEKRVKAHQEIYDKNIIALSDYNDGKELSFTKTARSKSFEQIRNQLANLYYGKTSYETFDNKNEDITFRTIDPELTNLTGIGDSLKNSVIERLQVLSDAKSDAMKGLIAGGIDEPGLKGDWWRPDKKFFAGIVDEKDRTKLFNSKEFLWIGNADINNILTEDMKAQAAEEQQKIKDALGFSYGPPEISNGVFTVEGEGVDLNYSKIFRQYTGKLFNPDDANADINGLLGQKISAKLAAGDGSDVSNLYNAVGRDYHNLGIYPRYLLDPLDGISKQNKEIIRDYVSVTQSKDKLARERLLTDLNNVKLNFTEAFIKTEDKDNILNLGDNSIPLFKELKNGSYPLSLKPWVVDATDKALKGITAKETEKLMQIVGGPIDQDPLKDEQDKKDYFVNAAKFGRELFIDQRFAGVPKIGKRWLAPIAQFKDKKKVDKLTTEQLKQTLNNLKTYVFQNAALIPQTGKNIDKDKNIETALLMRGYASLFGGLAEGRSDYLAPISDQTTLEEILRGLGSYDPLQKLQKEATTDAGGLAKDNLDSGLFANVDPNTGKVSYRKFTEEDYPTSVEKVRDLALNPYNEFRDMSIRSSLFDSLKNSVQKIKDLDKKTKLMIQDKITLLSFYYNGLAPWLGKDYITALNEGADEDRIPKFLGGFHWEVKYPEVYGLSSNAHKWLGGEQIYGKLPDEVWMKNRAQRVLDGVDLTKPIEPVAKANGGFIYAAQGQMVNFQPRGTDTVPAMLTPGEFVINKKATKNNLGLLKAINSGMDVGGYADGGVAYLRRGGRPRNTVSYDTTSYTDKPPAMGSTYEERRAYKERRSEQILAGLRADAERKETDRMVRRSLYPGVKPGVKDNKNSVEDYRERKQIERGKAEFYRRKAFRENFDYYSSAARDKKYPSVPAFSRPLRFIDFDEAKGIAFFEDENGKKVTGKFNLLDDESKQKILDQHNKKPGSSKPNSPIRQLDAFWRERATKGIYIHGVDERDPIMEAVWRKRPIRTFTSNVKDPKTGEFFTRDDMIYHRKTPDGKNIVLQDATGKRIIVPIDKLSDDDREWVRAQAKSKGGIVYAANGGYVDQQKFIKATTKLGVIGNSVKNMLGRYTSNPAGTEKLEKDINEVSSRNKVVVDKKLPKFAGFYHGPKKQLSFKSPMIERGLYEHEATHALQEAGSNWNNTEVKRIASEYSQDPKGWKYLRKLIKDRLGYSALYSSDDIKGLSFELVPNLIQYHDLIKTFGDSEGKNLYDDTMSRAMKAYGYAKGGPVYAARGGSYEELITKKGTDTIPAMLSAGEFVVNAQAAKNNLRLLQSINSSKMPYMADGGGPVGVKQTPQEAPQNISISNLAEFNKALNLFDTYVSRLEKIRLPEKIEMTGEHTVTVQIQGAAALEAMQDGVKNMIHTEINKQMNRLWTDTGGELGSRMA